MKTRFNDVGKILLGKRPFAPPMPAQSTWEIRTNGWGPVRVKLKGRTIVECTLVQYVGEPFERLTSTMVQTLRTGKYAFPFRFDLKMVEQ